jgi:hypothetical protein
MTFLKIVIGVAFASTLSFSAEAHDTLTDIGGSQDRGAVNNVVGSGGFLTNTAVPWVRKYYSPAGQCLHFEISQVDPVADLEMIVIAPRAETRYRDDDSGSQCAGCPRINRPASTQW